MSRVSFALHLGGVASVLSGVAVACGTNGIIDDGQGRARDGGAGQPGILDGSGGGSSVGGKGGGGTAGAGGGNAGGTTAGSTSPIGKTCVADSDCGTSLVCVKSDDNRFGGGPAGGVCTADCSADLTDDAIDTCADIDSNAVCVLFDDTSAFCLEGCEIGPAVAGRRKCHGRADMACSARAEETSGFCNPMCGSDGDCDGRICDLSQGLCVDELTTGTLPMGSACDAEARVDPCRGGFCIGVAAGDGGVSNAVCSGLCRLGAIGCGEDPQSPDPYDSLCLLVPSQASDVGDLGFCGQLCDCNGDCGNPEFVCDEGSESFLGSTGRVGSCTPKVASDGTVLRGIACAGTPPGAGGARGSGGASSGTGGAPTTDGG